MELRVLGCSGGIGAGLRTTSFLIDNDILIDAGTGVGDLRLEELHAIRHVFLTHSHLDHVASLPLLVDTLFGENHPPITIHALPETIGILQQHIFNWQLWPDFSQLPDSEQPSMRYAPMRYGETICIGERDILMIPANHTVPAAGYAVRNATASIAFSGDTTLNDDLWAALNTLPNLKLLIVECAFSNEEHALSELAKHYYPKLLAQDIAKLNTKPQIAITHLKPGHEALIMDQCQAAMPEFSVRQLRTADRFTF